MAEGDGRKYDALTTLFLGEQDAKQKEFETAPDMNDIKEEIHLNPEYSETVDIRQTRINFLVQHIPSTLINWWSINTGPRALKKGVEEWVTSLNNDQDLQRLIANNDQVTDKYIAIKELFNKWNEENGQNEN